MKQFLKIGYFHPWRVLSIVVMISMLAAWQLPDLRMEITAEGMMVKDDPLRQFYEQALDTFGSDNVTIVYFEDDNLFQRDKLLAIQKAVMQLNRSPLIDRTDSLFSIRHVYTKDGFTYTEPYFKRIPKSQDEIDSIKKAAKLNPLVAKNLISDDGKAMAINVYLNTSEYKRGFDDQANELINSIITPLKDQFETVFFIGDPYVRVGLTERIKEDLQNIIPVSLIFLVLSFAIVLRQFFASIVPLVTSMVSILWTLGLMAVLDVPVNVMTSIIPALLIIIGSTEDIHLLAESQFSNSQKADRQAAFENMVNNMWLAVLLTFITTYLGFISISMGHIELLQQFGLVASTGLVINFIITVLIVPLLLRFFDFSGGRKNKSNNVSKGKLLRSFALGIYEFAMHRPNMAKMLIVAVIAISAFYTSKIHINNNVMDFFDDTDSVNLNAAKLHENLSGIQTFSVILTGSQGTFLQVPYLQATWDIQEFLKDTGYIDSSFSFADFIAVIHAGLDSEWSDLVYLPSRNEVVREYMSLLDQSIVKNFVSSDFSQTRILVRHNMTDSEKLADAISAIENYAQAWVDPNIDVQITGESYLNSRATDYLATGQFQSLILILSVIFLIVSTLFMNFKAGVVAVLANILPVLVLFGIMGGAGIPINTGTSMVAAISLGVCVDYTMHFMVRYQRLTKVLHSSTQALYETFREESVPMMTTALALSAGFLTLTLSDFPPVKQFGQLSALVVIVSLIGTFLITTLLLQRIRLITVWDILSMDVKQQVLNSCTLFKDMSSWQAKKVIALTEIKNYQSGDVIIEQNMNVKQLYVVLNGEVDAWHTRSDGSAYLVNKVQPGGVFGMLSADSGQRCFTDMLAVNECKTMELSWGNLQQISKGYPRLTSTLFKNLSMLIASMLTNADKVIDKFHDENSGALNASVFFEVLENMVTSANRYDEDLSVISLKIAFKDHSVGLGKFFNNQLIGKIIKQNMRAPDCFGRISPDTFCVAYAKVNADVVGNIVRRIEDSINADQQLQAMNFELKIKPVNLEIGELFANFKQRMLITD